MKNKKIKLNLGCGVHLFGEPFINVDKYFTLEDLKTQKGFYANVIMEKGAKFVQADLLKLPFKNNYADYIICLDVIEHMRIRDVVPAIKK